MRTRKPIHNPISEQGAMLVALCGWDTMAPCLGRIEYQPVSRQAEQSAKVALGG